MESPHPVSYFGLPSTFCNTHLRGTAARDRERANHNLNGELLAERFRTDDLLPNIRDSCLLPSLTPSSIVPIQVVLGRPAGLLRSVGGRSAAVVKITRRVAVEITAVSSSPSFCHRLSSAPFQRLINTSQ